MSEVAEGSAVHELSGDEGDGSCMILDSMVVDIPAVPIDCIHGSVLSICVYIRSMLLWGLAGALHRYSGFCFLVNRAGLLHVLCMYLVFQKKKFPRTSLF